MKRHVLLFVFLACALAACGKKHVVTQPDLPPLDPPPPPERVVAPPAAADTVGGEQPKKPPEQEKAPRNPAGARPKPAVTEPPKPAEAPPPVLPPVAEAPKLETSDAKGQANEALAWIGQAKNFKGKVNTATLNRDAKEQYDTADRFITQAEQALTEKNPSLALRFAKNAATIMAALANR